MSEVQNKSDYQGAQVTSTTGYYQNYQYPTTPVSNQYYNTHLYNYSDYYNTPQQSYNSYDSYSYYPQTPESGYRSTSYSDESNTSLVYNTQVQTAKTELELKPENDEIKVNLSNSKLWSKFNDLTCEMIITKQGRRMFPTLQYEIDNLNATKKYNVFIDFIQTETTSMKFHAGKWVPSTTPSSEQKKTSVYLHPDSPNTGSFWMKNEIIFSKVKLTNNKKNPDSHMLLNSMHKYMPRIHIVEVNEQNAVPKTFMFNETKFIAVTAYQNTDVTQLKIDNNPFAKGFRENATREYENAVLISSENPIQSNQYSTPSSSVRYSTPSNSVQYSQYTPVNSQSYYNYYNVPSYYSHQSPIYNIYNNSSSAYQYIPTYQQFLTNNSSLLNQVNDKNYMPSTSKKRNYIESNEGDFYYQETDDKRRRL